MATVRFGIIACSSIARRRFLPGVCASSQARIERIGSRSREKANELARVFDCLKAGSYEEVLEDSDVDAVYISTPVTLHEQWVRKSIQHKKHVLCEKPAFMNYSAAQECVQLCRASDVRLMEGYSFQYHPQHSVVRSLILEGRIGELRFFDAQLTYPRPNKCDIRLNPDVGGGVFFDGAGYPVAGALLFLPDEPVSVHCAIGMDKQASVDNSVSIMMRFPEGQTAQITAGFGLHYRATYSVLGSKGRIEVKRAFSVPSDKSTTITLETDTGPETASVDPADQFQLMIEEFSKEIAQSSPVRKFENDLLRRQKVMDAAWRSNEEGRLVFLSEY